MAPKTKSMTSQPEVRPLRDVLRYRNDAVIYHFMECYNVSHREAESLFRDVLRFLWLSAKIRVGLVPNAPKSLAVYRWQGVMDEMWHTFILDSRAYVDFCNRYLGGYAHHTPGNKYAPLGKAASRAHEKQIDHHAEMVYDQLGKEVAFRWYVEYPKRYGLEASAFLDRRRVPLTRAGKRPPPKWGRRRIPPV